MIRHSGSEKISITYLLFVHTLFSCNFAMGWQCFFETQRSPGEEEQEREGGGGENSTLKKKKKASWSDNC